MTRQALEERMMSDKATMLRETDEALADLRALKGPVKSGDLHTLAATDSTRLARSLWASGSFWGLRYPSQGNDEREHLDSLRRAALPRPVETNEGDIASPSSRGRSRFT